MRAAVVFLALLLIAVAPQQQTFYSAKAEPHPVAPHTAQPVYDSYGNVYNTNCYYGSGHHGGRGRTSSGHYGGYTGGHNSRSAGITGYNHGGWSNNCNRGSHNRPSPGPRPSLRPAPHHS